MGHPVRAMGHRITQPGGDLGRLLSNPLKQVSSGSDQVTQGWQQQLGLESHHGWSQPWEHIVLSFCLERAVRVSFVDVVSLSVPGNRNYRNFPSRDNTPFPPAFLFKTQHSLF